jgi:hypothetical protein
MGRISAISLIVFTTTVIASSPETKAQTQPPSDAQRASRHVGAYSPEIEMRAMRMFPWSRQGQQREQWMADQEQRAIANEINRTKPLVYPVNGR